MTSSLLLILAVATRGINAWDCLPIPALPKAEITIGINPITTTGKRIRSQIQRDWFTYSCERLKDLPIRESLKVIVQDVLPHERKRRAIHALFKVRVVHTSDDDWFRINRGGKKQYIPHNQTEFPGYIIFFYWVGESWTQDWKMDRYKVLQNRRHCKWTHYNRKHKDIFTKKQIAKGYDYYDSEYEDEVHGYMLEGCFYKGRDFYSFEDLGWKDIPKLPTIPKPVPVTHPIWRFKK